MRVNFPLIWMVACFFRRPGVAMAKRNANSGSWSGVIMNSNCTADEAFAEARQVHRERCAGRKTFLV
jgi:hypothetical protein